LRIKFPHFAAFMHQRAVHHLSRFRIEHRQCLLASNGRRVFIAVLIITWEMKFKVKP
jgi:hypothetical protein